MLPSKIADKGRTVDTDAEGKYRRIKAVVLFLTGGGEATNTENMETLYASLWS